MPPKTEKKNTQSKHAHSTVTKKDKGKDEKKNKKTKIVTNALFPDFSFLPAELHLLIAYLTPDARSFHGLSISCKHMKEVCSNSKLLEIKKTEFAVWDLLRRPMHYTWTGDFIQKDDLDHTDYDDFFYWNLPQEAQELPNDSWSYDDTCFVQGRRLPNGQLHGMVDVYESQFGNESASSGILHSGRTESGEYITMHITGQYTYREGLRHGPASMLYYLSGGVRQQGNFVNGQAQGIHERFYDIDNATVAGPLYRTVSYVDGKITGPAKQWSTDGVLEKELTMLDGVRHGEILDYYVNGNLWYRYSIMEGVMNGKYEEFYDDTTKSKVYYMSTGRKRCGMFRSWYRNGQPKKETKMHCGIKMRKHSWTINGVLTVTDIIHSGKYCCHCGEDLSAMRDDGSIPIDTDNESYKAVA